MHALSSKVQILKQIHDNDFGLCAFKNSKLLADILNDFGLRLKKYLKLFNGNYIVYAT